MLLKLKSVVDMEDAATMYNNINVVRLSMLDSALRAFRRRAFNPCRRLDIVFVDACGDGEGSIGNGGPIQEFVRLLMQSILNTQYFVKPQDCKRLSLDAMG